MEGITGLCLFLLYFIVLIFVKVTPGKWLLVNGLFFLSFYNTAEYAEHVNHTALSPEKTIFQVQFSDQIKQNGDKIRAVVQERLTKEKLMLTYKIPSEDVKDILAQSQIIKKTCTISGKLTSPQNARNENAFNYQKYLYHKHIFWEIEVSEWDLTNCQSTSLSIIDYVTIWRSRGISLINKNFTSQTAPLAAALIFGTQDFLPDEMLQSYQKIGVIHIISISGLHVALLIGMIFYLGIRIGVVRERLTWALILTLPFYAFLTGASPSVNRSVFMTMMVLFVSQLKHSARLHSIDGLCLSFLLFTLWDPYIIYDIGFQLSYIVTFSLLLSLFIMARYHSSLSKVIITSYIAQLSSLPFLLYHFFEIPLISILANIIFVPLYSFILLPALIFLFFIQFVSPEIFRILSAYLSYLIELSDQLASILSSINWTRITPGRPSDLFLFLYGAVIIVSFIWWEQKKNLLLAFVLPFIVISAQIFHSVVSTEGEIAVIDVGQGDSIFIRLPNNKGNYLVDTGGTVSFTIDPWKRKNSKFEVGKDVVVPFLKAKGITKLDLLILTHGDMDHIGGSLAVLNELKVERILLPDVVAEHGSIESKLQNLAKKKRTAISYVHEGLSWNVNENQFTILGPAKSYVGEKNDGSIILHAKIAGVNWLFTGDLGKEGEDRIIKAYPNAQIDVLKVGHHGSRHSTSANFIKYFKPKYSIISVGEKNGFGHPHDEVIKILEAAGSKIFRTDLYGGITYKFNDKSGTFISVIP
ncbi:DNA internalization-related competence protein ComEC/Rec2 [Pseudoneobacillus sp. C159]